MYVYVYVYIYICIYLSIYIYICIYIHIYIGKDRRALDLVHSLPYFKGGLLRYFANPDSSLPDTISIYVSDLNGTGAGGGVRAAARMGPAPRAWKRPCRPVKTSA